MCFGGLGLGRERAWDITTDDTVGVPKTTSIENNCEDFLTQGFGGWEFTATLLYFTMN